MAQMSAQLEKYEVQMENKEEQFHVLEVELDR